MTSHVYDNDALPASPLLRLPFEVRLMIYEYLLLPSTRPSSGSGTSIANLVPDFHTYYSEDTNNDPFTLSVRTIDPWLGSQGARTWRRRSTYYIRTGPFLTSSTPTTYRVLLSPYTAHLRHAVPSLLALNKQIHTEATKILYSTYKFSFHTSIEAVVPFLDDLTPVARSHIRHLGLTKKPLPYTKEFDRAEWKSLCEYIASHHTASQTLTKTTTTDTTDASTPSHTNDLGFQLRTLHLNIITGKPDSGWDGITPITTSDFSTMMRMRNEWGGGSLGGVDLEWVEQLMLIRGLSGLKVKAFVEHCAKPVSEKQAFWVAFSKSVDEGAFAEWVGEVMVG
ncbi:hypothetical protein T440DRAFT_421016 [Plenodomus tracheiphilus IPT5]|uniref:Uncharacterized protein n=1 Tax=Plenodomus tracheiphilus IPT5 TaxID=1408161 RepID=A0A6A7BAF9_9PLEO|nr:hypothetical protein T440DRAFT_421016 [Plenodomus tracheiphilus IPT5]